MTSDTQNTAPERIWLQDDGDYTGAKQAAWDSDTGVTWCEDQINEDDTGYIRADLHERLVAKAVAAALEEAINRVNGCDRVSEVQPAIRALIYEKRPANRG